MIGFFTDPYPDELLYSACARYHRRARNLSKEATARDLFGNVRTKIIVDLQTRLNYLAAQLPPKTYTASRLIDEHTMLPYYAPFMPAERHEATRCDMCGEGGGSIHARLGVLTSGLNVERLRFCAACADEDREPYWHRVHQAPGVEVCPSHAVFLAESAVSVRNRSNDRAFVTARQAIGEMPLESRVARPLDLERRDHQILLRIAKDTEWILNVRGQTLGLDNLRRRYLRLLYERGIARYTGSVRHINLEKQFLDYYPATLLNRLDCGLEVRYHWLRSLVNNSAHTRHPLHHLLLMQFLGCPAEEFFRLPVKFEPFGKGPWPCLNAAGGHYLESRITECLIGHTQDKTNRPVGIFQCECGFSYKRIGADTTAGRRYQYDMIVSLGGGWYDKLREMFANGNHTRTEMARTLGVPVNTIKHEIRRLKRSDETGLPPQQRFSRRRTGSAVSESDLRKSHRKRWSEIAAKNPNKNRSALKCVAPAAYNWLVKHDKEWLKQNCPERCVNREKSPRVNWSKRDEEYSAAVRKTAESMRSFVGRPVWVSRTGIAKGLGILAVVNKNSAKLPLTNGALVEVSESSTSFAIRRIRWATDCYHQEHVPAARWEIQIRAAVSNKIALDPLVKAALDDCFRMLHEMNEAGWEN